jgi:hypothetical protein
MSDFVEQCRREWRRLGVPDLLAEEMATDLASDLSEAEAEGISTERFLGSSASDPQSFAASWAAERGIIPERSHRDSAHRRSRVLVAFTAIAAITVIVAALLLATGEPKVSLVTSKRTPPHLPLPAAGAVVPPAHVRSVVSTSAAAPIEWMLLFVAVVALGFAAWLWSGRNRTRPPTAAAS